MVHFLQFVPTEMSHTFLISPMLTVCSLPMSTFVLLIYIYIYIYIYIWNLVHFFVMRHFAISWVEIFSSAVWSKKICVHYLRNVKFHMRNNNNRHSCRVETESGGTRRRTGGEVKRKEVNGVGSQQSSAWLGTVLPVLLQSFSSYPHSKKANTRLNWDPRRYKWTRPFRWKTESGFCSCATTFRFHSTYSYCIFQTEFL